MPQGGRAISIAVAQSDAKRIVVASATGGLFRTFNGGISFQHLDGFPTFTPIDVAIASRNPNIVIATAKDDFRTESGGGIWRSIDGGASWSRPTGWPPPFPCSRPTARTISHITLTTTFHVATDCGIAVSADNAASFSMTVLDPARPRVRDVLVTSRTTGVAADDSVLWFLNQGTWQRANGGPISGGDRAIHGFAAPRWTGQPIFYHMGRDREIYFSTDAGASWEVMATPPHGGGREKFVRVGRGLDGNPTHFDVYFGDGFTMWRQAVTTAVPGGSNVWKQPNSMDHRDPSDVAFTPGYEVPLMATTDGGVHITSDSGRTWKLTGSNYGGFTALQIGEVTGRAVGGSKPHLDLYYATQDNDIKGSSDGGHTWPGSIAHEGAFLGADAANPAHIDGPVTGINCGGCTLFEAIPHLGSTSNPPLFRNAPTGSSANRADPPIQILGASYLQHVPTTGPPPTFDFFLTGDRGSTWIPVFSVPFPPFINTKFAGNLANPVAYVAVNRNPAVGLFRVQDLATQPVIRRADSTGMMSLGLLGTDQATYAVFGVDPTNANHLIAPDVFAKQMKASTNGGLSWFPLPALTAAVTDTGKFKFVVGMSAFATVISWDPTNNCHILVGTMQNGVIRSTDGGRTWGRVAGSTVPTFITSFFFPPTGAIWMSTYGRGLWTLSVDRTRPAESRCRFPGTPAPWPGDTPVVWPVVARASRPFRGLQDTVVCPTCTVVTVRKGWINDVRTQGTRVNGVVISSGILVERDRTGKELPLSVPNSYSDDEGDWLRRTLGRDLTDARRVRGLVLRAGDLVALVMAGDELAVPASRTPMLYLTGGKASRVPSVVESGGIVLVRGYGFLPGAGARGVSVKVGTEGVFGVDVMPDGTFSLEIPVSEGPRLLEVAATQRDGKRLTIERASITVMGR